MTTPADLRLGPLTTIFTAPAPCNSITVSTNTVDSTAAPYIYPRYFSSIANSCFPSLYPLGSSAIAATFGAYGYHDEHVYFSPGICPSGWNQNIAGISGSGTTAETTALCCMPGFGPQTTPAVDGAWGYYSTYCTFKLGTATVTTVPYTGDGAADGGTRTFTFSGNTIPAGAVWIRWRSADFATTPDAGTTITSRNAAPTSTGVVTTATNVLTSLKTETVQVSPSPASSAPPSTATTVLFSVSTETVQGATSAHPSTAAPSTISSASSPRSSSSPSDTSSTLKLSISPSGTQTSSSSTSTSNPSPSLSTGSKIGIGVGAGLAVLFALAILIFLLRRRKEKLYPNVSGGPEAEAISGI